MALANGAGVFAASTYAEETINWATQGTGQDLVNLFLVAPTIFIIVYLVHKKSLRAFLLWLGMLAYVIYSYVIYSFLGSLMNLDCDALLFHRAKRGVT